MGLFKINTEIIRGNSFGILGGYKVGSALSTSPVETDFPIRLFASLGGSGAEYTFTEIFARYYRVGERLFLSLDSL